MKQKTTPHERLLTALAPWSVLGVATFGGAAVVAGAFEPGYDARWFSALVAALVALTAAWDIRRRHREGTGDRLFALHEGPILWIVATWIAIRAAGPYAPHLYVLPAALLAWLAATRAPAVTAFAAGAAAVLEAGLTLTGNQTLPAFALHLLLLGAAMLGLRLFARSQVYREQVDAARAARAQESDLEARQRDFGLLTAQAPALRSLPSADDRPTVGRSTLDYLTESFALQLDMLRHGLGLTTAAVLWRTPDGLVLRGISSTRTDLAQGPYPAGLGLPGSVMRDLPEVAVAPVHDKFAGLPYYDAPGGVGAAMAVAVPATAALTDDAPTERGPAGVLCVDRATPRPWTEAERQVVRAAARKLALDVATGQRLKHADHERNTIRRFCVALQRLNASLGLEQVAEASLAAAQTMVAAELAVVSVVHGEVHRVVRAAGLYAERYADLQFTGEEGLVGRAIKVRSSLPATGEYKGNRPVFTAGDRLGEMRSLLVVPLTEPTGNTIGALTVAAREDGVFASPNREMLELIAGQVAVKLDLAAAHEQIRELATTDGLTGLNNHRTFQQAFDTMLSRADRRGDPMCVILTDIDKFKPLNDNYGHPFGDEVLRGVAAVLRNAVRKVDLAARYGGEEFAIILEGSDREGGRALAERIRAEVETLLFHHEVKGEVRTSLSLGVAAFPDDGREKETLIAHADLALYYAKAEGRNQVKAFADLPPGAEMPQKEDAASS
ncbi:MAG: GGDEF domain-containing protein [Myxococcales bacterium]|nr:GGDEF domain-containing protein [Myxococcales bacterium]